MWHHQIYRSALYQTVGIFTLLALITACTTPPSPPPPVAPAPPVTQRILIPTPEAVSAAQFVDAAAPAVDASTAPVAEETALETSPLTPAQTALLATLPSRGAAPELQNEVWFNTEPLTLTSLRGKVVMVEFWTYG